ncbi:MAG: TIGR04283 family arsenosugar biosynthesis glycosyltransferase [Rhodobacteraceae bacterium]|nr:TIGR04283 family arsenosugar biosynthesis glycosyltransferase [Paracoccaceae bacterium]
MTAPLSVVIPTLNVAGKLPETIDALLEGVRAELVRELIICDGGSDDETVALADQLGAVIIHTPPGRGLQLQRGAAVARGEWHLFLHADSVLEQGWSDIVFRHIAGRTDRAGYFDLRFTGQGFVSTWFAAWANMRSRWLSLPYGDQGLLIHRDLFSSVGGYQTIPLMEDVALSRRLRGHLTSLHCHATTGMESYTERGWFLGGCRNLGLLILYFLGVSPNRLVNWYVSDRSKISTPAPDR